MSSERGEQQQRLVDLMIDRATCRLSKSEADELARLASEADEAEMERLELSAAAFDLALTGDSVSELPRSLHDRVLMSAGKHFSATLPGRKQVGAGGEESEPAGPLSSLRPSVGERSKFSLREAGWMAALAASVLIMLTGWNPFASPSASPAGSGDGAVAVTPERVPTSEERLALLLQRAPSDLIELEWTPVHDPDASGSVVWSDQAQEGYMVFEGLDPNDPNLSQYQLWIFDNDREQVAPVDGGVFDIVAASQGGRVVIPIDPHVAIDKAVQFAVTVERPGGVYQSKREKIPVLATLAE